MDLRQYFRKIREVEATIHDRYPLVVSLETSDGGRAGLVSEISRAAAAKLIVEGRAVLASEEEKELYRRQQVCAKHAAEKAELMKRVQVAIVSDRDLKSRITTDIDDPCVTGT